LAEGKGQEMKIVLVLFLVLATFVARADEVKPAQGAPAEAKPVAASIEIFCDFRCPFCARLFGTLLPMAKAENRQLTFRFRHFPFHNGSQELAVFFEAARTQADADSLALIDSLYRFQRNVSPDDLRASEAALATLHGLNQSRLKRDLRARDVALAVRQDEQAALVMKVDHTPSVFVDGALLVGPPELIAMAVLRASPLAPSRDLPQDGDDCNVCKK
jgi:protein-disulfide isomerase